MRYCYSENMKKKTTKKPVFVIATKLGRRAANITYFTRDGEPVDAVNLEKVRDTQGTVSFYTRIAT